MGENKNPHAEGVLLHQLKINRMLQSKSDWQITFIEYIQEKNIELYEEAVKYTDDLESNDYLTQEEIKKIK